MNISPLLESEKQISITAATDYISFEVLRNQTLNPLMKRMLKEIQIYLKRGGKWVRPWLSRLAVRLLNKKITPSVIKASLSTELLHRYILVHDDIMDQDLERHHGPTLQKVYQDYHAKLYPNLPDETDALGNAIVAGDLIDTLVYQLVTESGLPPVTKLDLIRALNQDFMDTAAGWMLETDLKQRELGKIEEKEILLAMKQVSAHYSVLWPLRLGEIMAGRQYGNWLPELEAYGTQVGLAFQIQDDILAIFGEQKETGKPIGNDLREGKKTLLLNYAYKQSSLTDRAYLESCLHREISPNRLAKVRQIYEATGALAYAQQQAKIQIRGGIKALVKMRGVDETAKDVLIDLADFMVSRKV